MIKEIKTNQFRGFWEQIVAVHSFIRLKSSTLGPLSVASPSMTVALACNRNTSFHDVRTATMSKVLFQP